MEYLLTEEQIMEHAKARAMMPEDWCKVQNIQTLKAIGVTLQGLGHLNHTVLRALVDGLAKYGEVNVAAFSTSPELAGQARVTRTDGPDKVCPGKSVLCLDDGQQCGETCHVDPQFHLPGGTCLLRQPATCDATEERCVPYSRPGCFAGAPTDQPELHDTVEELAERAMEITTTDGEPDTMTNQYRVCNTRHLRDYPECHTECDHDVCISLPPAPSLEVCYDEACISFDLCAANPTKTTNCPNIVTEGPATVVPDTMTASVYESMVFAIVLDEAQLTHGALWGEGRYIAAAEQGTARIMELNRPDPALLTGLAQLRDSYQEVGDRRPFNMQASGSYETYRIVAGTISELLKRHGVKE